MQKIVIDTNVVVSAIIQRSYPNYIINQFLHEDIFLLCISEELMAEYIEVLSRPKFARFQDFFIRAESILAEIDQKSVKYKPEIKLDIINDKNDNKILELADICNADFIITGNTNDFTFPSYKKTKIVAPKEYWEIYKDK